MKLHRFLGDFDFSRSEFVIVDRDIVHQVTRVLRLREGDFLLLQNQAGEEAEVEITDQTDLKLWVEVKKVVKNERGAEKEVALYCAILKRENFELVVQKATEIGITKIIPLLTERTVKTGLNFERLEKIIKEAVEQSGRASAPELSPITSFTNAIENVHPDTTLFFDEHGEKFEPIESNTISIFIGPEGGWSPSEKELAKEKGLALASLGTTTLRGETAAIIASYLASH